MIGKTEYEKSLEGSLGNWVLYAETVQMIPYNAAIVIWNNFHFTGKYVICEAREDNSTRLFIRNVSNILMDAYKRSGWWNTFTVTEVPVSKGLWLAEIEEYYLDRNGFINLCVKTLLPMNDTKFYELFSFDRNGTWNSVAWWLMIVCSNAFLPEYNFRSSSNRIHKVNINALISHFPELEGKSVEEIGKIILYKYLRNEITLEEIEDCLNTPSERELLIKTIQRAISDHTIGNKFGILYPNFAKKIVGNVVENDYVSYELIEDYITRNIISYNDLVSEGKIDGNIVDFETSKPLEFVERVLLYREELKKAKKKIRNKEK